MAAAAVQATSTFDTHYGIHYDYYAFDLTVPPNTRHVPVLDYSHVAQVPQGPSMLEEKLACRMEDAAHERQFLTAQRGSSNAHFLVQHVAIVARTLDMMERWFLESGVIEMESAESASGNLVHIGRDTRYLQNLQYLGDWAAGAEAVKTDRIMEFDLATLDESDTLEDLFSDEIWKMLEQGGKRRRSGYRRKLGDVRIEKRVSRRSVAGLHADSRHSRPKFREALPEL